MAGEVVDRGLVSNVTAIFATLAVHAVSFLVDPWLMSSLPLAVSTSSLIASGSLMYALVDRQVRDVYGAERMASCFGLMSFLTSPAKLLGGFMPGWIYDATGSYDNAFIILGLTGLAAAVPLAIKIHYHKVTR
ncbi:uncharacterized protein LOC119721432 [Patiria miniata]|uniref:Monocarboxylate transporter n=1 Tax=Patiria miniata TaxID=46514 RepID=A0A913Z7L3_PATMI|nr:uncharacterized protein LOC119721432 [Patiria miniata]